MWTTQQRPRTLSYLAFAPDGSRLASLGGTSDRANEVQIWDTATGREWRTLRGGGENYIGTLNGLAFSPDGRTIAHGRGREVRVWELATGQVRLRITGHESQINSVAFGPSGRVLA